MELQSAHRYDITARFFHWCMAVLIVAAAGLALIIDEFPNGPVKLQVVQLHQAIGLSIILLVIARLAWRIGHKPPPLPADTPPLLLLASRLGHLGLYALMLATPILGMMLAFYRRDGVIDLWVMRIPSPFTPDRATARSIREVHELAAYMLLALAGGHALIALWHHFIRRDGLISRMA
jgi:cytochrome b561